MILAFGVSLSVALWALREPPPPALEVAERVLPVDVVVAELQAVTVDIPASGEVSAVHETQLSSSVGGQVVGMSPRFVVGELFSKGEVLVQLDRRDYRHAVSRASAELATARRALAQEEGRADVALREWRRAGPTRRGRQAKGLALRRPQLAEARAMLHAKVDQLGHAKDNLRRTTVRAPYAGIVRSRAVDIGSYVGVGTTIGRVFAVSRAQVRLPLPEAAVPLVAVRPPGAGPDFPEPVVILTTSDAAGGHWQGRLVRLEGVLDPVSRVLYAVAHVDDPYGLEREDPDYLPLRMGSFVSARIAGRLVEDIVVLPRELLRAGNTVWAVDAEDRLRLRRISFLSVGGKERLYVSSGLDDGDRVCMNPLGTVLPGTPVKVLSSITSSEWSARLGVATAALLR